MRRHSIPEYDHDVVEQHIRQSSALAPSENPDASVGGLLNALLDRVFPPTYQTDFTTRAELLKPEVRHLVALVHLLREGVRLTVIQGVVFLFDRFASETAGQLAWLYVALSLIGLASEVLFPGPGKLFLNLACISGPTAGCLLLLNERFHPYLFQFVIFWCCLIFTFAPRLAVSSWLIHLCLVISSLYLTRYLKVEVDGSLATYAMSGAILFAGNVVFTWVIADSFCEWMLANRGVQLMAIRRAVGSTSASLIFRTSVLRAGAWITGSLCIGSVLGFLRIFASKSNEPLEQVNAAIRCAGCLMIWHGANWLLAELAFHKRAPRPLAWFRSWYVAWRCLTAWLAYVPSVRAPVVFQFKRPWSNTSVRLMVTSLVLLVNSHCALQVGFQWLAHCTTVPALWASAKADVGPELPEQNRPEAFIDVLDWRMWLGIAAFATASPVALLWICLAAAWGPTLTAAHDAYELFSSRARAPVAAFPRRASL